MNKERLLNVLLGPIVSEKSTLISEKNRQFVFEVAKDAKKPEIKEAVQQLFKVEVEGVSVCNVKGKQKRFGRMLGRRKSWKKAYVALKEGHDINFAGTE
jgi:large subunit ribosomal protein L23